MPQYAEVSAEGVVTNVFENNGEVYTPAQGAFLIQSSQFAVGQRYEPVAGNIPNAFPFLGTLTVKLGKKGKDSDGDAA